MNFIWQKRALEQYRYWQKANRKTAARIDRLVAAIARDPFIGIGQPEPLKHTAGWWSRRITKRHRLVYRVQGNTIEIIQCRYHY